MEIKCPGLRDRRIAASDEVISVKRGQIYARGSVARRRGTAGLTRTDRSPSAIQAIVLHQTAGAFFLPPARNAYPASSSMNFEVRSRHRIDRITAHFVVINDGTIFYTHDVEYRLNSISGSKGIDIEFAGRFNRTSRLSRAAITAGRGLIQALKTAIPSISHIHPHGQLQRIDRQGQCGGETDNVCDKLHSCPGPDIWVNVGEWAGRRLGLTSATTVSGYQNNGISSRQSNSDFDQRV